MQAVVTGEVPLLLSRTTLSFLGMIYDVQKTVASFGALGIKDLDLSFTQTGHPAIVINPVDMQDRLTIQDWGSKEVLIAPLAAEEQYPVHTSWVATSSTMSRQSPKSAQLLFYPKKITPEAQALFLADSLTPSSFLTWWNETNLQSDFWVEGEGLYVTRSPTEITVLPESVGD